MADHLLEQTRPAHLNSVADYYREALAPSAPGVSVAEPREDMDARLAELLGIDRGRVMERDEIAGLLSGNRTDGAPIRGKQVQRATTSLAELLGLDGREIPTAADIDHFASGKKANGEPLVEQVPGAALWRLFGLYGGDDAAEITEADRQDMRVGRKVGGEALKRGTFLDRLTSSSSPIAYVDLTWSADKSISVAWALASTEAERALIAQAHRDAVSVALKSVEHEIGRARKGKAGKDGFDHGKIAWIRFDHFTSRPTIDMRRYDEETGQEYTEPVTLKMAGDPQLHTHVAMPNVVLTDTGRVGGLDLKRLKGRVHEFGALYQAHLANNLRELGADVMLDRATGAARMMDVPDSLRDAFSKRTLHGTQEAKKFAEEHLRDAEGQPSGWDNLSKESRIALLKQGVQGNPKQVKQDDLGDLDAWRREAEGLGWKPTSFLRLDRTRMPLSREARLEQAYHVGCDLLDERMQRQAVLMGGDARVCAARGLVASGIESAADIDDVTRAFTARGVRQHGQETGLIWIRTTDAHGEEAVRLTTQLHVDQEAELVELARRAAEDRSGALDKALIDAAVARGGRDFKGPHGERQLAVMHGLGSSGRLSVAIGVAGSGKSTVLAPLIDAWLAEGRVVHGTALAWKQTEGFPEAGIESKHLKALSVFLDHAQQGKIDLTENSVVVVDELGQLGTRQLLDLLRLREKHGFQVVAVGDPLQCQSIEAGPVIDLLRKALGADAVPELLTTVRQITERERDTSLMFRQGRAAEALDRKREDSRAIAVPGGHDEAVDYIAALWHERRKTNAAESGYTLTVSAPTNADARAISVAIRRRRQQAGELGPDETVLAAIDQNGASYDLALAVGDRVRLFKRTNAAYPDRSRGIIGNNGSVLEVCGIGPDGLALRNAQSHEGHVKWTTLRDPASGRILLNYGDVLSIDATQGITSTEHIEAMPSGTRAVNAYKGYTAASRHRRATWLVTSDGAERREIVGRRLLGDTRHIDEADVWANMARNLARAPAKESALALLDQAMDVKRGAVRALRKSYLRIEQRELSGLEPTILHKSVDRQRLAQAVGELAGPLQQLGARQAIERDVVKSWSEGFVRQIGSAVSQALPALKAAMGRRKRALLLTRAEQEGFGAALQTRFALRQMAKAIEPIWRARPGITTGLVPAMNAAVAGQVTNLIPLIQAAASNRKTRLLLQKLDLKIVSRAWQARLAIEGSARLIRPLQGLLEDRWLPGKAYGEMLVIMVLGAVGQTLDQAVPLLRERMDDRRRQRWADDILERHVPRQTLPKKGDVAIWAIAQDTGPRAINNVTSGLSLFQDDLVAVDIPREIIRGATGRHYFIVPIAALRTYLRSLKIEQHGSVAERIKAAKRNDASARQELLVTAVVQSVSKANSDVAAAQELVGDMSKDGWLTVIIPNFAGARAAPESPRAKFREQFAAFAQRKRGSHEIQYGLAAFSRWHFGRGLEGIGFIPEEDVKARISPQNARDVVAALTEMQEMLKLTRETGDVGTRRLAAAKRTGGSKSKDGPGL